VFWRVKRTVGDQTILRHKFAVGVRFHVCASGRSAESQRLDSLLDTAEKEEFISFVSTHLKSSRTPNTT
jgi:hypothetical protein